jgi:predicted heme/steroid binding protein
MNLLIAGEDLLEERCPEEREQREILQSVPAVGGRIDERAPVRRST